MSVRPLALLWAASVALAMTLASARADSADPRVEAEVRRLRSASLAQFVERSSRLVRVSDALRLAGAPLCGDETSPVLGVVAASREDLAAPLRNAAARDLGVGDEVRVLSVLPGLAAWDAGLRAGDVITAVEGEAIHTWSSSAKTRQGGYGISVRLDTRRQGVARTLGVETRIGCLGAATLRISERVTASSGTGRIHATTALMRFTSSDDELAVILGHEIAHQVLGQGGTPRTESEADTLGLYLAARAGFDVAVAPGLWKRWTLRSPLMIHEQRRATHPSSPERALRLGATLEEIARKRAAGLPLDPEPRR